MERYKDTDLREALRRKYAATPQLPTDFMERMERRMETFTAPSEEGRATTRRRLWPWVAAAACLLFVVGISVLLTDIASRTETKVIAMTEPLPYRMKENNAQSLPSLVGERLGVRSVNSSPQSVTHRTAQTQRKKLPPAPPQQGKRVAARSDSRQEEPTSVEAVADSRQEEPTSVEALQNEYAQQTNRVQQAEPLPEVLTERDIPITRPENYKYTPEEIALLKRQAAEAYLKWVELELEIAKHSQEQTAQQH